MSLLLSIKKELQHIVEAINAVTNVDIIVVDEHLKRIVSTVKKEYEFGTIAPTNSAFHKSIITGEQFFLENPKVDPICTECKNFENCKELIEFCIPIKYKDEIIGVLGMCAYDEIAKENLLANKDSYMNFENQLSDIISTIISEKNNAKMLEYSSSKLMTLINSLKDGIVIINNNKDIITTNNYVNEKLNLNPNKMPVIWELLSDKIYNKLVNQNFNGEVGPVKLNGIEFMINSCPIMIGDIQDGIVLLLSDFNKMRESVLESNRKKDLITFDDIVGESELLLQARREAIQVAEKDASVLIMGETGTGKEVFARAIHYASSRRNDAFMAINCGAITESLIESELFGYEKGSFTGANNTGKPGKFETCKDGTLFLDEIGDLPFMMQVKLNRALEEKEITRVGGNISIKVNPRIISATHKNLYSMVGKNLFRDDLYYRLNVVPIFLPPLRERGYDIIVLSRYFLNRFAAVYNKELKGFTSDAERLLMGYNFPGNIRELRNLVEYAVIFEEGSFVGAENLRRKMGAYEEIDNIKLEDLTKAYEKSVIQNKMQKIGDNFESKKEVAKQLGISIATLYRKLEE
ncbi:transcriptional regulator with PAS, ATPase and Fis domain [Sedimentibacter acidaminivorans]|uniref:Transcriptional regulator with PAS, ATPase and Fis domain n=1 Tax=Sedimentibacter acidaminivorans TaxID=913099 RepID=A0ABS4GEA8_9FIRM|nr:sigma 54-interacting transcriptional regulator [Sedimentibacter acidaminivorans]MBP1926014.1 transcriptional regulator with PAS, ATPase and Fis domain [Sedimentibacter acidaminivorans]